jgi:hypothetical protein
MAFIPRRPPEADDEEYAVAIAKQKADPSVAVATSG